MGLDLRQLGILLLAGAAAGTMPGCASQTPPGDTITVHAPANDTVSMAAAPTGDACCPQPTCKNTWAGVVPPGPVGPDGLVNVGTLKNYVDATNYTITSVSGAPTTCLGYTDFASLQCEMTFTLPCEPVPSNAAQGTAAVSGQEDVECWYSPTDIQPGPCPGPPGSGGKTVYNGGTVSVTFDGQTVSATYGGGSAAAGLASELALALDRNSTLSSQFVSAANGDVALVHALNAGTQYDYPWTSSCTYNVVYFNSCSFTVGLSPAGSLSSP